VGLRICLLYSPTGNGHRAAAHAIARAIHAEARDVRVDVLDVLRFAPASFRYDRLWSLIQQHGSRVYDVLFDVADRPHPLWRIARERLNVQLLAPLAAELERLQPDWIVCTHYLPAIAVAYLRRTRRLAGCTATVITDYLAHEAWLCPGIDRYFVATAAVADDLRARGVAGIELTGIPIAPEMDEAVTLPPQGGRALFLAAGVPRRLVCEALISIPQGVPLDIVAGNDLGLRDELRRQRGGAVHGFIPGLRALIDRADVVITKAGGLIVSECLARGRAMVLPWPAPGQERGNRAHAIAVGAARVCEPRDTGAVLANLPVLAMGHAAARAAGRGAAARIATRLLSERARDVAPRRRALP
jgi:processive 1,2-diacylglycerol beta-glucosyltransferase